MHKLSKVERGKWLYGLEGIKRINKFKNNMWEEQLVDPLNYYITSVNKPVNL